MPIELNQDWNIISRTILPVVWQNDIFHGAGSQFGIGDIVQSVFFSPKTPTAGGWIWGAGPVYETYQNELFLFRAHTARLIKDYAAAYEEMTDEKAKALLDELMRIDALGLKLRQTYLPKFREILPDKKVARYYQIENKIQAALNYELAVEIPLVQ